MTEDIVTKKLKLLNINKSSGPDDIPPIFLCNCANTLAPPLTKIFNASLKQGIFPEVLKEARVVPVHKKGNKTDISNYRPISILSSIAKVFESLIYPLILSHVRNALSNDQHGFLPKRSTNTNLVGYVNQAAELVDQNIQVDTIYTDFSNAFDRVDHRILVQKLRAYGVRDPLLSWCRSYLNNRKSRVVLDGSASIQYRIVSGVPQGSNLGPLFFLIYLLMTFANT